MKKMAWHALPLWGFLFGCVAVVAGCYGGTGMQAALPPLRDAGSADTVDANRTVEASLRIFFPRTRAASLAPQYVSPHTKSIAVVVAPTKGTPIPRQLLVVKAPPCTSITGGLSCDFPLRVKLGTETFSLKAYASANGTGAALSTLQTGVLSVGKKHSKPLHFVLEGVVHDVALGVPSPEASTVPPTQVIPVATPATFPLTVTPYDASGAQILISTFAAPVALSVSPANAGVSLTVASQCPGESGPLSGTTVKLACADDLSRVTVSYDGTVTRSGGNVVDTMTISASPHPIDVVHPPVHVALRSAMREVTFFNTNSGTAALELAPAPNGLMYFFSDGLSDVLGSFDPNHPTTTLKQVAASTMIYSIFVDSHNDVWLGRSGQLECYTSVSYPPAAKTTLGFNAPAAITQSGSNIWYEIQDQSFLTASVGFITPGANCTGVPASSSASAQLGTGKFNPISAAADGSGIWATANIGGSPFDGEAFAATTASSGSLASAVDFGSTYGTEGSASDSSGNLYVGLLPNGYGGSSKIEKIPAGSTSAQAFATLPPNAIPYGIAVYPRTGSASQIAVVDGGYGPHRGLVLIDPSGSTPEVYLPFNASDNCFNAAYDLNGGVWAPCEDTGGNFVAFNPVVTSRWAAVPTSYGIPYADVPETTAIGILEAPGTDSAPFTVVGNSDPTVMATASPWPGMTHDIPITIENFGSTTLTIADKHNRTQTVKVDVELTTYAKRRPKRLTRHL